MKYLDLVMELMRCLVVATCADLGELLYHRGLYGNLVSGINNAQKILRYLTDSGQLEKGGKFYRLPGSQSQYGEHARSLTRALVTLLRQVPAAQIVREKLIKPIMVIPDALVLLRHDGQGRCIILEVMRSEKPAYLTAKVDAWQSWSGAEAYLSGVFSCKIPHFEFVIYPESPLEGAWGFSDFVQEVLCDLKPTA